MRQGRDFTAHFESAPYDTNESVWTTFSKNQAKTLNSKQNVTTKCQKVVVLRTQRLTTEMAHFVGYNSPLQPANVIINEILDFVRRMRFLENELVKHQFLHFQVERNPVAGVAIGQEIDPRVNCQLISHGDFVQEMAEALLAVAGVHLLLVADPTPQIASIATLSRSENCPESSVSESEFCPTIATF